MKTKIAAIAVLLLAGSAPAALAQEQGEHHHERPDQSGGERTPHDVGGRPAEQHMVRPQAQPQFRPQSQPQRAPQPPQAPPQGGERWHGGGGAPGGERPGGWRHGGPSNFNGGGAPQPQAQAPAQPQQTWRGDHRGDHQGDRGGDHRPPVDSWGGRDHRAPGGDHNGYRGGEPGQWSGDHRQWNNGGRDSDHGGDRGGDHNDWRGGHRAPPPGNHPRWTPGRYPHAYRSSHRFHGRPYYAPPGFYAHSWAYGEILPQAWFAPDYVIEDWWDFGLPEPPYGYDWVRVGNDALLVDGYSGQIMQVVRDLFW
jgi:Ni/Co efflux regulator RcnB